MNLKESRHIIISLMYVQEVKNEGVENSLKNVNHFLEDFVTKDEETVFLDIIEKIEVIDEYIVNNLENYTIERLSLVDKQIIRLSVYELMYTDTPSAIIINSAIELSKEYTETDDFISSKFNNKLIDKIGKKVRG